MESAELAALLLRLTVAATVAVAIILALRRPLRAVFGANVAYGSWALLPAVMIAAAFSRMVPEGPSAPMIAWVTPTSDLALEPGVPLFTLDAAVIATTVWVIGLLLWLSARTYTQWRWRRGIGALRYVSEDMAYAATAPSLPAVLGWPRAIIVLPADFESRFSEPERFLVLAHERSHIERGDLHAQMLGEAIRALFWFHPLVHWAATRFRHDQELACDADVISRHSGEVTAYARALIGAAGLSLPPVATAWGFAHPLKERIAMLQHSPRSLSRRRAGLALVAFMLVLASGLAWASLTRAPATPPDGKLRQTWTLNIDGGEKLGPFLLVDVPGVPVEIGFDHAGEAWLLRASARPMPEGRYDLSATIRRGGVVVAEPRLVLDAQGGAIQVGEERPEGFRGLRAEVKVEAGDGLAVAAHVPAYPEGLAKAGVEGRVLLRVAVDAEGRATAVDIEESSGNAALDASAQSTARSWRFKPGTQDGQAVASEVLVPVDFRAKGEAGAEDA